MKLKFNCNTKTIIDLSICFGITFLIFFHTLHRPWIFYDENIIYDETLFPIPASFSEIFEIIGSFGLSTNLNSSNFLYSSNSVTRFNLFDIPIRLFIGFLFQKNAFLYHSLALCLHLLNIAIVYQILKWCFSNSKRLITVLLTLLWAIHPAQIESVLLTTNFVATFNYSVFFLLFLDFIKNKERNVSLKRRVVLPFCFLLPMLINEYIVALPVILFTYGFIDNLKSINIKDSFKIALQQSLPYLIGLVIYVVYFIFSSYQFSYPASINPLILLTERVFWFAPQIFFHFIKLIFFPRTLSLDQSAFVGLGKSLFDTYSIFCMVFILLWITVPLIIFLSKKKNNGFLFLSWLFFISMLPFSQFLSQTYCLASERYLYTPLFFIIFGLAKILKENTRASVKPAPTIFTILLFTVLILCFTRSLFSTFDWKDNNTLIQSLIKSSPNDLYKGMRLKTLAEQTAIFNSKKIKKAEQYYLESQRYFHKVLKNYKKQKNNNTNEPLILKSYGLDTNSLIIKCIHFISFGALLFSQEDYKKYLNLFNPYLKYIDCFDPRTLELYANLLIKDNEIKKAKEIFLYAYKKYPSSPFILLSLIRFEREIEKDLTMTKKYLIEGRKLYPYSKEILFETLRYNQLANNLNEYTDNSYLYGLRAHSKFTYQEALTGYLILEQLDKAKKVVDKLMKTDPFDPRSLYLSGSYYIKKRDYNQALLLLNQAYSLIQKNNIDSELAFHITNTLATVYFSSGNTQQGIHHAQEALKYAQNNPENLVKIKKLLKDVGIEP